MPSDANMFGLNEDGESKLHDWQLKACSLIEGNSRPVAALCIQFANVILPHARRADESLTSGPGLPFQGARNGFRHIDSVGGGVAFFDCEHIETGCEARRSSLCSMKRDSSYIVRLSAGLWPQTRNGAALPESHPPLRIREPRLRLQDIFSAVRAPEYRDSIFTLALARAPADEAASLGGRLPSSVIREAFPIPCWIVEDGGQFEDTHDTTGADFNLLLQMRSSLHGAEVVGNAFVQAQQEFWETRSDILFAQGVWLETMEHLRLIGLSGLRNPDALEASRDVSILARFAAMATGGEIAIHLGLVPWEPGSASMAISRCYADALAFIESYMALSAECATSDYARLTTRKAWPGYEAHLPFGLRRRLARSIR